MVLFSVCALCTLQFSPAAGAIVGSNLLEYVGECPCVDLRALVDGHCSSGLVVVPARNDTLRIRDDAAVIKEDINMVFGGEQCADVALKHEVRLACALDSFCYLGVGSVDQCANFATDLLLPLRKGIDIGVDARIGRILLNLN